jgi:mono/diheme cytochrome c family protein
MKPDRRSIKGAMVLLTLLSLAGCYGEMNNQPRYRYLAPSRFFADGASARTPPGGTVSREEAPPGGGLRPTDVETDTVRPDLTEQLLARGQQRFGIYCMPCHGPAAEGNGTVVQHGFPPPKTFLSERVRNMPDSHFFGAMTNGYGRMFPYADRVSVADRWAIIAYIRALQLSQQVPLSDLPPDLAGRARKELK